MALLVPEDVKHSDIVNVIAEAAPPELENVALFDIFSGESVGPGQKSMAYSLRYRSSSRTLTDEEANAYHDRVKDALKSRLQIVVRDH